MWAAVDWLDLGAELGRWLFIILYTVVLVAICLYGIHRYVLIYLFYRNKAKTPQPAGRFDTLPLVTVQLPVYNEQYVVGRLIERACQIAYPRDRLEIQVLDDSTDETVDICRAVVARMQAAGFDVTYLHRENRIGYKAGALEAGLKQAKGEFVLIFDADFLPEPDILNRTIHYFTDPTVGMVQTRWEHINRSYSLLTKGQAVYLDGHFIVEHTARNRSGRFMNFNGTAGIWRKRAIEDAGGWQHDTLTEDLDLSFRAQLKGWRFVYLPDLTSPAELPIEMNSFKSQQHRWTKGGIQTALKLLPAILRSDWPLRVKVEAFFHLTASSVYLYMFLMSLMVMPAFFVRDRLGRTSSLALAGLDASVFLLATCAAASFFLVSQREVRAHWLRQILYLPFLMALGIGIAAVNTKGILEAIFRRSSEFARTPKFGVTALQDGSWKHRKYRGRRDWMPLIEILMGLYFTVLLVVAWDRQTLISLPFCLLFMSGYYYVGLMSLFQSRPARAMETAAARAAARPSVG